MGLLSLRLQIPHHHLLQNQVYCMIKNNMIANQIKQHKIALATNYVSCYIHMTLSTLYLLVRKHTIYIYIHNMYVHTCVYALYKQLYAQVASAHKLILVHAYTHS